MISGFITLGDYVSAQRLHRRRALKRLLYIALGLIVAGLLSIAFGYFLIGITLICACIGGAIGESVQSLLLLPRRYKRTYSQYAALKSSFSYSWNDEFLTVETENGHARRPWGNYIKAVEGTNLFLLYLTDNMFEMIPKSWFQEPSQLVAFRGMVNRIGT